MVITIAGSRNFEDYEKGKSFIDDCLSKIENDEITVLSGGCRGSDKIGERFAKEKNYNLIIYRAEWDKYGKAAGIIRNKKMADRSDCIICFWDGKSKGTKSLIDYALKKSVTVFVCYI